MPEVDSERSIETFDWISGAKGTVRLPWAGVAPQLLWMRVFVARLRGPVR